MIQVKEFSSAAEMQAHYRAVRAKFFTLPEKKPKPAPKEPLIKVDLTKEIEALLEHFGEVEIAERKKPEIEGEFIPEPGVPGAKKILAHVAQKHKMTTEVILGPRKRQDVVEARWEAILIIHQTNPKWSLPKVGRFFNRDHTSILNALRKMGVRS